MKKSNIKERKFKIKLKLGKYRFSFYSINWWHFYKYKSTLDKVNAKLKSMTEEEKDKLLQDLRSLV